MSRALAAFVVLSALALGARPPAVRGDAVQIGQSAPAFLIETLDGRKITGNFDGRPAYINFFTTWCSPCRRELPAILDQVRQYHNRIAFVLVDEQEQPSDVKRFAESLGIATPVAVDRGEFASTFDVDGLPWSIFIDRHGVVQYIYRGWIPPGVLSDQLSKLTSS